MNKTNLKRYAPQARKDFIAAVTARAHLLGLSDGVGKDAGHPQAEPCTVSGEVALIAGRPWPASVQGQRDQLLQRMRREGFGPTLEAVAYTWFNRLAALRFMELHEYLGHGRRVLSNPAGAGLPEVLAHALELAEAGDLPGLRADKVRELKLANHDGELYRRALIAQCNALHQAMPFLFEAIDDQTELLLPDNLLLSDSVVAKLVAEIPEEDWAEVEAIGWLYQFYISEKKDAVIGKVVKSEDIPAATQLFTPNWIVQYLVQNSVGRLWLMANPGSTLASQWPYYLQPAEQTPEVQAQLDALIQTRIREDGEALNPETITVLDPACGSGHILVVAYDVLKAIYLERGYQPRAIPRLILEKNLYGLDIDDRAAQLAGFALLMKARADDRRLFNDPPKLNVLALQESKGLDADEIVQALDTVRSGAVVGRVSPQGVTRQSTVEFGDGNLYPGTSPQRNLGESAATKTSGCAALTRPTIAALIDTFAHAKTFGSLIQIPPELNAALATMAEGLQQAIQNGDLYTEAAAQDMLPLVAEARVLGMQFDAVVANPPYMGSKGMNAALKEYAKATFPNSKSDLFAMFIERGFGWCKTTGFNSMVTMQSWMFLSSFEAMREGLLRDRTLSCMLHMGNGVKGIAFGTAATVFRNQHVGAYEGRFSYCGNDNVNEVGIPAQFPVRNDRLKTAKPDDFKKIPGSPAAYWVSSALYAGFQAGVLLETVAHPTGGMTTGDNSSFVRLWTEIDFNKVGLGCESRKDAQETGRKWFPYNKGGQFRKWYGNNECLVNWQDDGLEILTSGRAFARSKDRYFKPGITWTDISSSSFGVRIVNAGFIFDATGPSAFPESGDRLLCLGFLVSRIAFNVLKILNPTMHFQVGNVGSLPLLKRELANKKKRIESLACEAIFISKADWDSFEISWEFQNFPWLVNSSESAGAKGDWNDWLELVNRRIREVQSLETENNRIFIEVYGLQDELSPEVPEDQITLARADREKDCQRLISYAIGCMMGRYSLDEPGLIYAHAGNVGFDPSRYTTFLADADGIVPLTDERWFEDGAAGRVREFLYAVWGAETLEENLAWLAESLGAKGSETPDETIRRYLADKFFKDHLQTYKKRPIYWLFSSGKLGAFQALVYLHRYHEGTLARLRAEYVVPLTGKMQSRVESLEADVRAAASTAARTKLNKQLEALRKQQLELLAYDEKLRHFADQRIRIDLDDGVKVNYGKFGDLLAEVKAVTGGSADD